MKHKCNSFPLGSAVNKTDTVRITTASSEEFTATRDPAMLGRRGQNGGHTRSRNPRLPDLEVKQA